MPLEVRSSFAPSLRTGVETVGVSVGEGLRFCCSCCATCFATMPAMSLAKASWSMWKWTWTVVVGENKYGNSIPYRSHNYLGHFRENSAADKE